MDDWLVFGPGDVDLARSPLRASLDAETFVLGAFNPGMTRLPNGNLLLMVRVAEALAEPIRDGHIHAIRWTAGGFVLDRWPLDGVDARDPRMFRFTEEPWRPLGLTSLS
ncbi:MAG: glycosidase, partial [Sphingomonadales bacterium]